MRLMPSFPLLAKELAELAARRRTYALRSVYALALGAAFALMYQQHLRWRSDGIGMLGTGGELFDVLFWCQYWAILLLMPALAATAITHEKEQGSLTLLLLTDMGPWELVLQKWLSRLVAVGGFLLLSMPLMALCYAYGGLPSERLWSGIYLLAITCVQTAALALAVSAWCRSSLAALVGSYLALGCVYLGPSLALLLVDAVLGWNLRWLTLPFEDYLWPANFYLPAYAPGNADPLLIVRDSAAVPLSAIVFLAAARWSLVRRAHLAGPGPLLRLFQRLDALFERGDAALGRRRADDHLPHQDPVAWREFNRRSLANWRYLLRIGVPCLGIVLIVDSVAARNGLPLIQGVLQVTGLGLLGLALLLVVTFGASLVAAERAQQTIDVLLTTPLTARDILVQKGRGLRRIMLVMTIPALGFGMAHVLVEGAWRFNFWESASFGSLVWARLTAMAAYYLILPPLFGWFAVAIGLHVRNRNRAVLIALIGACMWFGSTMVLGAILFGMLNLNEQSTAMMPCYLTPGMLPLITENDLRDDIYGGPWLAIACFVLWHGGLWLVLRWWCLRHADRLLRRGTAA
jgi:ABC-type transport system involved in multi-copper enzyme maturation permease subunit